MEYEEIGIFSIIDTEQEPPHFFCCCWG